MTNWLYLDFSDYFTVSKIVLIFLQINWIKRTFFDKLDLVCNNKPSFCQLGLPPFKKIPKCPFNQVPFRQKST